MYITSYFVWSCRFCPVAQEVSGSLGKDSGWSAIKCAHVFSCKSLSTVHEINIDACNWTICQFHYLDFLNPPKGNAVMGRLVGESYPPNRTDKTSHQHMFQKSCTNLSVATKTPHPLWTFKGTTSCVAANGIQLQTWKRCYRKIVANQFLWLIKSKEAVQSVHNSKWRVQRMTIYHHQNDQKITSKGKMDGMEAARNGWGHV